MAANSDKRWRHHAFPVVLQKYWKTSERINWFDSSAGKVSRKFGRKTTGWRPFGHTEFGDTWGTGDDAINSFNYEPLFDRVDSTIHQTINGLMRHNPKVHRLRDLSELLRYLFGFRKTPLRIGSPVHLGEKLHRNLLELMFSLVDRSLAFRRSMEGYSVFDDEWSRNQVGAVNIASSFSRDSEIARTGATDHHHFLLLYEDKAKFVFPDGLPNWIVMRATGGRVWGRLLVPLTPSLCVYFSTPNQKLLVSQCTALLCHPFLRTKLNELFVLYSEDKTYFQGEAPSELPLHTLGQRWVIDPNFDPTINFLDCISGYREPATVQCLQHALAQHLLENGFQGRGGGEITLPPGYEKRLKPNSL